jgi:hypothetical protein
MLRVTGGDLTGCTVLAHGPDPTCEISGPWGPDDEGREPFPRAWPELNPADYESGLAPPPPLTDEQRADRGLPPRTAGDDPRF